MRTETDFLGSVDLPSGALYGIHAWRARENFPDATTFPKEWYQAVGLVKQACYQTYKRFKQAAQDKYPDRLTHLNVMHDAVIEALIAAAQEVATGKHKVHFIVPAMQGGAGTSINMNINEIICNLALQKSGKAAGEYQYIDPIEQANIYQSTNDVVPTALKLAAMQQLTRLEEAINRLRQGIEQHESKHRNSLRIAYTQMQAALPSSYGQLLSTYSEALSRDWWRVSKCFERIKVVNIGGGAIGTGLSIPRFFVMEVVNELQSLSRLPLTRSENLADATSHHDSLVEVHAILKAHAVNLEKMANDLRLLSADLLGQTDIHLPARQTGSSVMPGKVNPVVPEFVISIAHKIYANDSLISGLCGQACLDLNAYIPTIGYALLESLRLLLAANQSLTDRLIAGMTIDTEVAEKKLYDSPAITTALLPYIGYHAANKLAHLMTTKNIDVFLANKELNLLAESKLKDVLKPQNLLRQGFTLKDIL